MTPARTSSPNRRSSRSSSQRQRALAEDRVAELLELVQDLVVQARIVVVRTRQHDDADAVLALQLVEHLASLLADLLLVLVVQLRSANSTARSFSSGLSPSSGSKHANICCANSFLSARLMIGSRNVTPCSAKTSISFVKAAFTVSGRRGDGRAGVRALQLHELGGQHVEHREEDQVELLLERLDHQQVVDVRRCRSWPGSTGRSRRGWRPRGTGRSMV